MDASKDIFDLLLCDELDVAALAIVEWSPSCSYATWFLTQLRDLHIGPSCCRLVSLRRTLKQIGCALT